MASSNLFAAGTALPPGYRQSDSSGRVGPDFAIIDALTADSVVARFETSSRTGADELQFILYAGNVVSLRNLLPFISGMGLEALDEQTMSMVRPDGFECHVYQFNLCAGPAVAEAVAQWDAQAAERASATFAAVWAASRSPWCMSM